MVGKPSLDVSGNTACPHPPRAAAEAHEASLSVVGVLVLDDVMTCRINKEAHNHGFPALC